MRVHEGIPRPGTAKGPSAVTIGVFDGLHLGHKALLETCRTEADKLGGEAVVLTFQDHPDRLLRGKAPPRLQTEEAQLEGLAEAGMDLVVRIPFDEKTRDLSAATFAEEILVQGLGCKTLVLGFDSAICKGREGTLEAFQKLGKTGGFRALRVPPVLVDGKPVSSSSIREALRAGDLDKVARLLGRPWGFQGKVEPGRKLGRELGFPTANVKPPSILLPPYGVYAALVTVEEEDHPAVVNLGIRPSVPSQSPSPLCEAHLLDGPAALEDKVLRFAFLAFLREEKRFPTLDALRQAIAQDCARAQNFFCRAQP
ncbi:MAG TPA: riboflavin biosynthesis protein RibF [Planctomycetes bacterium]|nr:riboflavin biosynthesis protein RibF [Planctomycetota bacterium]